MQQEIQKNIDGTCFQYAFAFTQHCNEIKNNRERVSFIPLYNWKSIVCTTSINKTNYTLLAELILELPLVVLYDDVDAVAFKRA